MTTNASLAKLNNSEHRVLQKSQQTHRAAACVTVRRCVCVESVLTAAPGFEQRLDADFKKARVLLAGHGCVAGSVAVATQGWRDERESRQGGRLAASHAAELSRYVSCVSSVHQLPATSLSFCLARLPPHSL